MTYIAFDSQETDSVDTNTSKTGTAQKQPESRPDINNANCDACHHDRCSLHHAVTCCSSKTDITTQVIERAIADNMAYTFRELPFDARNKIVESMKQVQQETMRAVMEKIDEWAEDIVWSYNVEYQRLYPRHLEELKEQIKGIGVKE